MPPRSNPAARVPGRSGSLCKLLALLLLLAPPRPLVRAGPVSTVLRELRCLCLGYTPGIRPKMIRNLQVIAAGPQCPKVEVIVTLRKSGKEVCINPEAPLFKKAIKKILDSGKQKD
ncbi:alveolar macrophage chemotactic factor [Echinops telfairi]|uniref:Alveolar macrophage chemotactic factor n=1 Tax=Echinops telfairi TaxID=9371 RepID=A0ABM0IM60_ECHTE|nr:alveolar macrophage chemotactic factor [Echinops telfairi]